MCIAVDMKWGVEGERNITKSHPLLRVSIDTLRGGRYFFHTFYLSICFCPQNSRRSL